MEPGIYRLTKDVQNPEPDRRVKRDWRALPVWEAGRLFVVCEETLDIPVSFPVDRTYLTIHSGEWSHQSKNVDSVPQALMKNFEPVAPDTVDMLLLYKDRIQRGAGKPWLKEAVEVLVRDGKITIEDLSAALDTAYEECEEE